MMYKIACNDTTPSIGSLNGTFPLFTNIDLHVTFFLITTAHHGVVTTGEVFKVDKE